MAGQDNKNSDSDGGISANSVDSTDAAHNTDVNITEEYDFLDSKLDELNSALDFLEQKNDDIHEKLKVLLQANRDIRQQLRTENNNATEATNL